MKYAAFNRRLSGELSSEFGYKSRFLFPQTTIERLSPYTITINTITINHAAVRIDRRNPKLFFICQYELQAHCGKTWVYSMQ
jgi:hypothetical protein